MKTATNHAVMRAFSGGLFLILISAVSAPSVMAVEPPRNLALVFAPEGGLEVEYDKRHMLPGPESGYVVGERPGLFAAAGAPWGVEICKDMDFPRWARAYGQGGVRVLAVPAWDFVTDGRLHSRMAVVRGVENGFAIARAARNGLLTFSDAYGRILAELPSNTQPEATLARGYAIVREKESGEVVKRRKDVEDGSIIQVRVSDGEFEAEVKENGRK